MDESLEATLRRLGDSSESVPATRSILLDKCYDGAELAEWAKDFEGGVIAMPIGFFGGGLASRWGARRFGARGGHPRSS